MARKKSIREIGNQAFRIMANSYGNSSRVEKARSIGMRYIKNIERKSKLGRKVSVTRSYVRNTYMGTKARGAVAG